jgi:hypothetical protein
MSDTGGSNVKCSCHYAGRVYNYFLTTKKMIIFVFKVINNFKLVYYSVVV